MDGSNAPSTPTSTSGPTPPPTDGEVSANVTINNDWGIGYCAEVVVSNNTQNTSDWTVVFQIERAVRDIWNTTYTQDRD